jgi:putative ABC transport system permease protein
LPAPIFEVPMKTMLGDTAAELRHASRVLAKRPGYAAVAAFTLALGIGATVAMFTVVNAVLIRPLPYPASDRIVEVRHHAPGLGMPTMQSSPGLVLRYREHARTLTPMAGYSSRLFNLAGSGNPERIAAAAVTPELFDVLATRPIAGRPFHDADAAPGAPPVAILTHDMWQTRFGADPRVVGRTIRLDGRAAEIVGVMPRGFAFPHRETRMLVPLAIDPQSGFGAFGMSSIARLRPGVTLDAARKEIEQLQERVPEWFPGLTKETLANFRWSVTMEPLRERMVGGISQSLWILLGTVGFVLLIAGANVANLFLVRAESRQREVAVRTALGASRGRIARAFFAESLVLAVLGGAAGLLIAAGGTRLLVAYGPAQLPRLHEVRMDVTVVLVAIALTVSSAVALGMLPMLKFARRSFAMVIREPGRAVTAGRDRHRVRKLLIAAQVAMAVVLLVGSGLMLRSAARLRAVDPGFRADGLLVAGVSLGAERDRARAVAFYHQALDELARVPGVASVGGATSLPISATGLNGANFALKSRPASGQTVPPFTMYVAVTAGFFETLGVPLVEGRLPDRMDSERGRAVAWVNSAFARQFLDGRAVGESIQIQDTWLEIAGVVGDVRTMGLREDPRPMVYVTPGTASVGLDILLAVIRTDAAPAALAPALRAAVDRVDASVPLTTTRTMNDIVAASVAQASFTLALLAIAAGIALVLGVVGLYGAISYIVADRAAEIGIRVALGASPAAVRAMVLRQGVGVALAGVVVGLAVSSLTTRLMASLLFEIPARDPATFAAVAVTLLVVSAVATWLPARRAAGIDPLHALRGQ